MSRVLSGEGRGGGMMFEEQILDGGLKDSFQGSLNPGWTGKTAGKIP